MLDNSVNLEAKNIYADLSLFSSLVLESAKLQSLKITTNGNEQPIRPFLSLLMRAPLGQTKSTILHEIARFGKSDNEEPRRIITEITRAGLVGSVDTKSHNYTIGYAWQNRNDISLFDEFRPSGSDFYARKDTESALLQLLEHGYYEKKLALQTNPYSMIDGGFYCKAQDGLISVRVNMPSIFATMQRFDRVTSDYVRALVTRVIPYEFKMNLEELQQLILRGHGLQLKHFDVAKEYVISDSITYEISNFVKEELRSLESENNNRPFPIRTVIGAIPNFGEVSITQKVEHDRSYESSVSEQLYMRTFGDCCRAYAILKTLDKELFSKICKLKFYTQKKIGHTKEIIH